MKLGTDILEAYERCPIVFQGHPLTSKVTGAEKSADFSPI